MNEIVNTQTLLFFKSIQIGILLGMIYDLIRIFRKIIPHPNFLVQVEDFFYWISCSLIGFGILYIHNYGDIRFFVFIGIVLGAIFYFATFSILFMKIATYCINLVKSILRYLFKMISIPIKALWHLFSIPIRYIERQLGIAKQKQKYRYRKFKRRLYHQKAMIRTERRIKQKERIYKRRKTD